MSSILGTSLRNPAPTSGSIRKGAIPAGNVISRKRGLPTVGSLQRPTLSTSVTEVQTNSTAAAPIFCKPFVKEYEKNYTEGDILFVKAEDASTSARNAFHTVANLPVLNYLLRTTKDADKSTGALTRRTYRATADGLKNVLDHWHFFGILLNDMDTSSEFQRLLNVTVRGRCRLPNYWSTDAGRAYGNKKLSKGSIVWLGLTKMKHRGAEVIGCPDGSKELVQATGSSIGEEEYWQFVPVLENDGMGGGNKEWDVCEYRLPIGVIHQLPFKNTPLKRQRSAIHVSSQGKLLERMEVFVRI